VTTTTTSTEEAETRAPYVIGLTDEKEDQSFQEDRLINASISEFSGSKGTTISLQTEPKYKNYHKNTKFNIQNINESSALNDQKGNSLYTYGSENTIQAQSLQGEHELTSSTHSVAYTEQAEEYPMSTDVAEPTFVSERYGSVTPPVSEIYSETQNTMILHGVGFTYKEPKQESRENHKFNATMPLISSKNKSIYSLTTEGKHEHTSRDRNMTSKSSVAELTYDTKQRGESVSHTSVSSYTLGNYLNVISNLSTPYIKSEGLITTTGSPHTVSTQMLQHYFNTMSTSLSGQEDRSVQNETNITHKEAMEQIQENTKFPDAFDYTKHRVTSQEYPQSELSDTSAAYSRSKGITKQTAVDSLYSSTNSLQDYSTAHNTSMPTNYYKPYVMSITPATGTSMKEPTQMSEAYFTSSTSVTELPYLKNTGTTLSPVALFTHKDVTHRKENSTSTRTEMKTTFTEEDELITQTTKLTHVRPRSTLQVYSNTTSSTVTTNGLEHTEFMRPLKEYSVSYHEETKVTSAPETAFTEFTATSQEDHDADNSEAHSSDATRMKVPTMYTETEDTVQTSNAGVLYTESMQESQEYSTTINPTVLPVNNKPRAFTEYLQKEPTQSYEEYSKTSSNTVSKVHYNESETYPPATLYMHTPTHISEQQFSTQYTFPTTYFTENRTIANGTRVMPLLSVHRSQVNFDTPETSSSNSQFEILSVHHSNREGTSISSAHIENETLENSMYTTEIPLEETLNGMYASHEKGSGRTATETAATVSLSEGVYEKTTKTYPYLFRKQTDAPQVLDYIYTKPPSYPTMATEQPNKFNLKVTVVPSGSETNIPLSIQNKMFNVSTMHDETTIPTLVTSNIPSTVSGILSSTTEFGLTNDTITPSLATMPGL